MFKIHPKISSMAISGSVVGVLLFCQELSAQEASSWKCLKCEASVEPLKVGFCAPDNAKKTTTNYSFKREDICLASPDANKNCVSKFIACNLPSTWQAWCKFTGGVVREKRTLEKSVETKEVKTRKCNVIYECPCCNERFKSKDGSGDR